MVGVDNGYVQKGGGFQTRWLLETLISRGWAGSHGRQPHELLIPQLLSPLSADRVGLHSDVIAIL